MAKRGESKILDWMLARVSHQGDECLVWPFSGNWNGYGQLGFRGRIQKSHRVMCILAHGDPPDGNVAAHSCHNRTCVNPRHLSWKTQRENLLQRRQAGTLTKKRWTAKGVLTDIDVFAICALKDHLNQRQIGALFGISYQHVSVIQNRKLKRQRAA